MTWEPLINMEGVSLHDLVSSFDEDSAIGRATARLIRDLDDPDGVLSAFQSEIQ